MEEINLENVDSNLFDKVWKQYVEFDSLENHFNNLQNKYRLLAATCYLATFAAVGFILSIKENEVHLPVEKNYIIAGVCLVGFFGILIFWMIDLMVYHRLLIAVFYEGKKLEAKYPWLPQIRHNISKITVGGVMRQLKIFYIVTSNSLLILLFIALSIKLGFCIWFGAIPIIIFTNGYIVLKTGSASKLRNKYFNTDL